MYVSSNFMYISVVNSRMERVRGIGPLSIPWEGIILPMYYTRIAISIIYLVIVLIYRRL